MNDFEKALLNYFTPEQLFKIQKIKIGLAGAGGLGSNCACNLARSGFKNFYLYDSDAVETGNLNRQFYFLDQVGIDKVTALKENLLRINPDLNIITKKIIITDDNITGLFKECDIVVEAFDKAECKVMIAHHYINSSKFFVSASGLAGIGNSNDINTKKVNDNFYIIGDLQTATTDKIKPYSPRVNIAAAKQADIILDWVLNLSGKNK